MNTPLPRRVFRSPLIEFANFSDGTFVNLIKLTKPYANGQTYAVYHGVKDSPRPNRLIRSYDKAKELFEVSVKAMALNSPLRNRGLTGNSIEPLNK